MSSSNYRRLLIVAVISILWSKNAFIAGRIIQNNKVVQRNETGENVEIAIQCPENEIPNEYGAAGLYCSADLESDMMYYQSDAPPKCICAVGFRKLYSGVCVSEKDCIKMFYCPHHEIPNLNNVRERTCNDDGDDDDDEIWMSQKCLCPPGKLRRDDGSCVVRSMCGVSPNIY